MRAEEELLIGEALTRQWKALTEMGADLAREGNGDRMKGVAVFERLIDGCLFTLSYSLNSTPALRVLDWRLTDHRLN
jgi:hypothetical protein